jgi:predicted dehydrogenase
MSTSKVRVGVIGCGNISATYLRVGPAFEALEFVACADLDEERARARAAEFGIPKAYGVAELLADPEESDYCAGA